MQAAPVLKREVGNWVDGDRFWDRVDEIAQFIEHLDEGAHILLIAPRRTGKTSLMREVSRRLDDRYICVHADLEHCRSATDAIVELSVATREHRGLWSKVRDGFGRLLGRADELKIDEIILKLRDGVGDAWQQTGDRYFAELANAEKPVALFIDELPILVNRMLREGEAGSGRAAVDVFMSWLRSVAQRHRGKVRLVISGSIGLGPVLQAANLSATINHFTPFQLDPWTPAIAEGCLEALARHYTLILGAGVTARMVEHLGWCIPHHVQTFFSHVYEDARRRREEVVEVEDVDRVYKERMLSSRGHAELSHYEERLRLVLGEDVLPVALDLLTEAAITGRLGAEVANAIIEDHRPDDSVSARRVLLRRLLDLLDHDGYLRAVDGGFGFRSKLLRDWWEARFGFGYVARAGAGS
ncbi:MAG: ATP-binding protein [bacterium]